MKFFVNEDCIGCGLCVDACPEIFEMTDDNLAKAIDDHVEPSLEDSALEAQQMCPVSAIEES